jgi:hypothetical protein
VQATHGYLRRGPEPGARLSQVAWAPAPGGFPTPLDIRIPFAAMGVRRGSPPPHPEEKTDVINTSVRIATPPEVVFPYFTDPQLMVTWIGQRANLDARPGGTFASTSTTPPPRAAT